MALVTSSSLNGIEIGRRALQAQQSGLQVASHNIANANTPGYSRRRLEIENAESGIPGGVGSGADAVEVTRQRSRFLDAQFRVEQQVLGRWEALEDALTGIEGIFNEPAGAGSSEAGTIFNEPSGLGLSGSFSRFWNAWQDLANVPESGAARAAVRQEGDFFVNTMRHLSSQLGDTRIGLDQEVTDEVEAINAVLDQLAELNSQIPQSRFSGGTEGDLLDKRDRLVEDLASRVDISVIEATNGQISVLLSGHNLVQGGEVSHLAVRPLSQNGFPTATIFFEDDGSLAQIQEGRLRGITEVRDNTIPDFLDRLDEIASSFVEEVNRAHRAGTGAVGSTNIDFFDSTKTSAGSIDLAAAIREDLNNIAASEDGASGDNGTALAIAGLRNKTVLGSGSQTLESFFATLLGEVGARSKEAQTMADNHRLFTTQIENRRQSIQGVSLNDEAASLILFQRAYQAAARTVSILDDLLETTINL